MQTIVYLPSMIYDLRITSYLQMNDSNLEVYVTQGATIKAEEGTGRILIARVMHGGAADRSGLISCGDEVIEVNGINVEGKTPNDVLKILVIILLL